MPNVASGVSAALGAIRSARISSFESMEALDFGLFAGNLPRTPDPQAMKLGKVKALFWNEVVSRNEFEMLRQC